MLKKVQISLSTGSKRTYYAEFNDGYSHILIDDHCYQVVNGRSGDAKLGYHLSREALEHLSKLPSNTDVVQAVLGY